ncbi:MAG TPA: hypothetical protein VK399_11655 [Longimicrobiaceae bacterium]|nr:hypothetical protein [Longimicrobiaceae bacterium]
MMALHRFELPRHDHSFIGTWHIYAMELWNAYYFNMEVQAYVEVRTDNLGDFQFGLVSGGLSGYLEGEPPRQRFSFTWEGNDEMDPASGSGWLRLKGDDEVLGLIRFHLGDRSRFKARRVRPTGVPGQTS